MDLRPFFKWAFALSVVNGGFVSLVYIAFVLSR